MERYVPPQPEREKELQTNDVPEGLSHSDKLFVNTSHILAAVFSATVVRPTKTVL